MNRLNSFKLRLRVGVGLAGVAAAVYAASILFVAGADTKTADARAADTKSEKKTEKKADKKNKLTGAQLYAIHCNRCHAERYPTEWTSGQWKTLMTHMRVRANLPAAQAKEILKYLQEDSGN
jgi:cytochrome c5